jgi:hypothetical protein
MPISLKRDGTQRGGVLHSFSIQKRMRADWQGLRAIKRQWE